MGYSKEYFKLQIDIAKKAGEIEGLPIADALLKFTGFYLNFKPQNADFDANNPAWREYIVKIGDGNSDLLDRTYEFYQSRLRITLPLDVNMSKQFGCFSHELSKKDNCIYIHFKNEIGANPSSLSNSEKEKRLKELREMFAFIKEQNYGVKYVCGHSWLYNIDAYKRLFPREYIENAKVYTGWFTGSAIWGQIVNSANEVKPEYIKRFEEIIPKAKTIDELRMCFEYPVLDTEAPIEVFYRHYEV